MAAHSIRAIYTQGLLRPLEPLPFSEGEEVALMVLSDRERLEAALGDLLMPRPPALDDEEDIDEAALLRHQNDARVAAALGDLLVQIPPSLDEDEDIDEEAILRDLYEATRGLPPLSEELIEERRNGP